MQYFGGKAKIAKKLTEFLNAEIKRLDIQTFIEPFVGGLNITPLIKCKLRIASDILPMKGLYEHVRDGKTLPVNVSETQYLETKKTYNGSPEHLFICVACAFGGAMGHGYARDLRRNTDFAATGKRSLLKKLSTCQDVIFLQKPYQELPHSQNALIYCDPPYANTAGYTRTGKFNHEVFWQWVRDRSQENHVYVSEYTAPDDFEVVWQTETKTDMRIKDGTKSARTEKLFKWKGYLSGKAI